MKTSSDGSAEKDNNSNIQYLEFTIYILGPLTYSFPGSKNRALTTVLEIRTEKYRLENQNQKNIFFFDTLTRKTIG
jgi:hypothetical protein